MKSLSGCCHILLFYGRGPTDLHLFPSGESALTALTHEETAIAVFGKSPFVRTRNGLRYLLSNDPIFLSDVGETHQDQCLATFAALSLPLETSITLKTEARSIVDLLSESIASFSFDQKELAWTAIAFAKYLPPRKEWTNRFREKFSFSTLVAHLLSRDLNRESCAGTHVVQALVQIGISDRARPVLEAKARDHLHWFVSDKIQQLLRRQQADGSWSKQWCDGINHDNGPLTPFQMSFLVTGHLLEMLDLLDPSARPPDSLYLGAAEWIQQCLNSPEIRPDGSWLCPFTHAVRSAYGIRKRFAVGERNMNTFRLPSGEADRGVSGRDRGAENRTTNHQTKL